MKAIILEHPLLMHKLSILRDKNTGTKEFREVAGEIASILCYEATRDAKLNDVITNGLITNDVKLNDVKLNVESTQSIHVIIITIILIIKVGCLS